MRALAIFFVLQALDVVTTYIGRQHGAGEASPVVRFLLTFGPMAGLILCKVLAVGLVVVAYLNARPQVIRKINFFYAALIAWNCIVLYRVMY